MSNENWYKTDNWYSPLTEQKADGGSGTDKKKKERKKGFTPMRITGLVLVLLVLIVATSLAFSHGKGGEQQLPNLPDKGFAPFEPFNIPGEKGELPDDWQDFFSNFYKNVQKDVTEINIPRAELPVDFSLQLMEQDDEELTLQQLYKKSSPSIVAISGYVEGMNGYNWGTGVVLSQDGLILTNTHVIDGCDSATVTLSDDSVYEAKLVGADVISDIAVLKIEAQGLTPASFGDSSVLSVGDRVAAIGNPLGETFRSTLTDGIISAIERGINHNGHSMNLLQTNTAINEGNSGGALFNMYGQVIGVTNMKMMSSFSSIEGIGFAIPSNTVKEVVDSICTYGEVKGRPSIGITVGAIPENAAEHYDLPHGLYISAVSPGSDAEKKGVKAGDILLEVNGQEVQTTEDVNAIKSPLHVGDTMSFKIWREGKTFEVEIQLMDTNQVYKNK